MIWSLPEIFILKFFFCSVFVLLPYLFLFVDRAAMLLCPYCTTHNTNIPARAGFFFSVLYLNIFVLTVLVLPFVFYCTTHAHNTNIPARGGIQTRNPSKRSAADPRLRPLGHWDRSDSNLQFQQASGYKPTPYIARPLGPIRTRISVSPSVV
jgi:hypothetical protein